MDISGLHNEAIPFGQHIASDNQFLESAFKIEIERSFYVLSLLVVVYIHIASHRSLVFSALLTEISIFKLNGLTGSF